MPGHEACNFSGGKRVRCDRCKNSFVCTPTTDLYCTPEGDHACEPCLTGGLPVFTVTMLEAHPVTFPYRIAGLDLSLTGTGIATHAGGDLTTRTIDGSRLTGHKRLQTIMTAVGELRHYDLVVIEDVFQAGRGDTSIRLAELHGLVKHWLWLRGIPYVLVHNTAVKTYALGKGSGAGTTKEAVVLAVERRYGGFVTVSDNNQADALVLLAMALERYGVPLVDVPPTHQRALSKVTGWPALEGAEAGRD